MRPLPDLPKKYFGMPMEILAIKDTMTGTIHYQKLYGAMDFTEELCII